MEETFSKETIGSKKLPAYWYYCFNGQCPLCSDCIRFITGQYVDDGDDHGLAVFPNALRDGKCRHFKQARFVNLAWGFSKLFDDVKYRDASRLRAFIKAYLGGHNAYYRYANGKHKLTPEQQEGVRNIFRRNGYTENLEFDHYEYMPDLE